MIPRWLRNGLREADAVMRRVGLSAPPNLRIEPLKPERLWIKSVIAPGDYVVCFQFPVDPALNSERVPSSFVAMASRNGGALQQVGQVNGKDAREITVTSSAFGSGSWRYYVKAVNENGENISEPMAVNW